MSRPKRTFTPEELAIVERAGAMGFTRSMVAELLGISEATLRRVRHENPDLMSALERGEAFAQMAVGCALFEKAVAGNIAAIRWWEMTRMGKRPGLSVNCNRSQSPFVLITNGQPNHG
ncbi:MAG: hypothetical protein KDC71_20345 [Acidobacteria bacterium]|nr:hypothetical protein [Acidobacteriota bacterium]MCB9236253.1 hypothetical protein [Bacteroidia bacterium]